MLAISQAVSNWAIVASVTVLGMLPWLPSASRPFASSHDRSRVAPSTVFRLLPPSALAFWVKPANSICR